MSESSSPRPAFDDVPPARRRGLAAARGKDTAPELRVRRLPHRMGYRFRPHRRDLPGTPGIVLAGRRKIIEALGWSVLVLWECETKNEAALTARLRSFLA